MVVGDKKLVAILGATGTQGGSVARKLLRDLKDKYAVRALTRNANSAKAQELVKLGAEAVACDIDKQEDLDRAFAGAYAVFAVTNFWDMEVIKARGPKFEEEQGAKIEQAAKKSNVQHLIWSSLDNVEEISKGKYKHVYHFTCKARVEERLKKSGLPVSFFLPANYLSNYFSFPMMTPKKQADGTYEFGLPVRPDVQVPFLDTDYTTGEVVVAMLENRDKVLGQRVYGYTEYLTHSQLAQQMSEHFGKKVVYKYTPLPDGALEHMDDMSREMTEMNLWFDEFGYYGGADTSITKTLLPHLGSFKEFMQRTKPQLAEQ
ncbi:hypothetical protein RI367_004143 [Sorochytrium milnesiophthora]